MREQLKPRVGVSACLLGDAVRYNGGHKRHAWLVDVLGREVEWVSVCPEVEIGLGTPREPIELVGAAGGPIQLLTVSTRVDLTERMRRFAEQRVEALSALGLSGYVLKADSPSCGLADGLFADVLVRRLPSLPVVEERDLDEAAGRDAFVARVRDYHVKMHS